MFFCGQRRIESRAVPLAGMQRDKVTLAILSGCAALIPSDWDDTITLPRNFCVKLIEVSSKLNVNAGSSLYCSQSVWNLSKKGERFARVHASNRLISNISAFSRLKTGCLAMNDLAHPVVTVLSASDLTVYLLSK